MCSSISQARRHIISLISYNKDRVMRAGPADRGSPQSAGFLFCPEGWWAREGSLEKVVHELTLNG